MDSLDSVIEKYRGLYTEQADGKFYLDEVLAALIDPAGLKKTNADLKDEKKTLKEKLEALQLKIDSEDETKLEEQKEYEKLLDIKTKQYETKLTAAEEKAKKIEGSLKTQMISTAINEIAVQLAGDNSPLIAPHLKDRFAVDLTGDKAKLQILDKEGTPGIVTKEQLIEEFKTNKMFQPILKGRDSSGGGAQGGAGGGAQGDKSAWKDYFDPSNEKYNTEKQYELQQKDKGLHDKLVADYHLDDPYSS